MAYQGIYGRGLTASSLANSLRELDDYVGSQSYWQYAEGKLASQYNEANLAYENQYRNAIDEAYASSQRQRRAAQNVGLVGQASEEYSRQISDAYQKAYESYQKSLEEGRQQTFESYMSSVGELNQTMTTRAENFAEFGNKHYEYLQYLYNKYYANSDKPYGPWQNDIFRNEFIVTNTDPNDGRPMFDEEGNPVTDEQGNQLYEHLRSIQSLYNASTDEEGTYTSVYDKDGALTPYGRMYFDMIENMEYGGDVETFGDWLYSEDPELWKYMYESRNVFDISGQQYGNVGTFKELTGREASDYSYSIAEHFSAMSQGTIKSYFTSAYDKINEVFSGSMKDRAQTAINNSGQIVDQLEKLANDLGIQQDFGSGTWDELRNLIKNVDSYVKSGGEMTGDWFNSVFETSSSAAILGGAMGGAAGLMFGPAAGITSSVGAVGGAFIGAVAGLIGGIVQGSINVDKSRKQNEQYANQLRDQLRYVVDSMVGYSLGKREGVQNLTQYGQDFANQMAQQRINEANKSRMEREEERKENEEQAKKEVVKSTFITG